jgi:hypothetical protein
VSAAAAAALDDVPIPSPSSEGAKAGEDSGPYHHLGVFVAKEYIPRLANERAGNLDALY